MVNEIKKIIDNYEGISWLNVEDSGEGKLIGISINKVDTLQFDEETYNKWEDFLDGIDIIKPTYQIYCSWDKSGYNFWNKNQEESNYTYIDIWLSDDFEDKDIENLFYEINDILYRIDMFLNYYIKD